MNILKKLTIKNLKLNKKRTIVTIIGIMLSVALITAVSTMYSSAVKSLINYETYHQGNFHIAFYNVNKKDIYLIENNKGVDKIFLTSNIGYAKLENSKNAFKPYIYVKAFTKDALNNLSVKLIEGRLPQKENEILIPSHLKTNGRVTYSVGQTITLNVGKRIDNDKNELDQYNPYNPENNEKIIETTDKNYKIVGIIERPATNIENYEAPGYTFITYLDSENISNNVDVYANLNKFGTKNYLSICANILQIDETKMIKYFNMDFTDKDYDEIINEISKAKYQYEINGYLIELQGNPLKNSAMGGLGIIALIVCIIIALTSIFCIKNSFDISITEKIKQYGMLRSIGATKRQIRNNVFYEATILGIIGIPLGILLGFIASYLLIIISNLLLIDILTIGLKLVLSFSFLSILIAIGLGIFTIYLSALRSAYKASKVSPINSIRNSANIKIKSKKIKSPKYINKIFGIGGQISYKNFKRNKKKYKTTIISIIVSVSVFIGLSYFMNSAFESVSSEITTYDYNISLSASNLKENTTLKNKMLNTINLDNINDYEIKKEGYLLLKKPKYNKKYIELAKLDEETIKGDGIIDIISIGEHQYKKYIKEQNLNYEEYKNKAILYSGYEKFEIFNEEEKKIETKYAIRYDYKNGEIINVFNEETNKEDKIVIGCVSNTKPFGPYQNKTVLIVSDEMYNKLFKDNSSVTIYYQTKNSNQLQNDIDELLKGEEYYLENIDEHSKLMNNLFTLIAIFLYGFIIVISLIGITNIFNTITTSMNLRKQEFAMLKSVGMTKKEFKKMIRLESIFIGAKSLFYGITIGLLISYLIYNYMGKESGFTFKIPMLAIIISIAAVYLLISVLMKYSMNKINKENTIETIRNENI